MNRPMSLLWFEGMDPQSSAPSRSLFASHGCDLQLEPAPLVERGQGHYQIHPPHVPAQDSRYEEEPLSDEDTHLILERLRELGYLE